MRIMEHVKICEIYIFFFKGWEHVDLKSRVEGSEQMV